MEYFQYLITLFTSPDLIFLIGLGVFLGVYIGAIPGLSVTMAVSLLISFTFAWDVLPAIAIMIGIHVGGVYGGSRAAILLNIPGAPAAVATTFDGYPLARLGLAGKALGITAVYSVIGGLVGTVFLAVGAGIISSFALQVGSMEYFLLAVFALFLVGTIGGSSLAKGLFSVALGLFLGMIGLDFATGLPRFTFGNVGLLNGIDYVCAMIGLFGFSEALLQLRDLSKRSVRQTIDRIVPKARDVKRHMPLALLSSTIGAFIGALPGAGGDIAALFAYGTAKKVVKNPERPFGEGAMEGIVAPESANNAAVSGAYIPMLTLGIPGDAVAAVVIGALSIHGVTAGPTLIASRPDIFYLMVGGMVVANIFLVIFGLTGLKLFAKIVEVPKQILMPLIMILSVVGSYAINNNIYDVYWMVGFGILGYVFKQYGIPVAPMVLGIILTGIIEENFRRAVLLSGSTPIGFVESMFGAPITTILSLALIFVVCKQAGLFTKIKARINRAKQRDAT